MRTLVVGGGPAGMIAAYFRALNGEEVVLLEKNEKLGKKLYITGKGRCNVTNNCSSEEFLANVATNPKFLTGAARRFSPEDFMAFLSKKLPLKTERGNRVFPLSDKASDVTKCLESYLKDANVDIRLNERVTKISKTDDIFRIETENGEFSGGNVILCTGGKSYPLTGSTGDGYKFAEKMGHTVTKLRPALVGIDLNEDTARIQGVTLKNVKLKAIVGDKEFEEFGELLFTHFGISGPIVLTLSSYLNKYNIKDVKLYLDLKPALSVEQLDDRVIRDFEKYKNKLVRNSLDDLLIKSLIPIVIEKSGVNCEVKNSEFNKESRKKLVNTIKNMELFPCGLRPLDEAIVTSGGVKVEEINPKTMESKIVKGLYFAGEIIDVDAFTGGFNITIAACTGYAAGGNQ